MNGKFEWLNELPLLEFHIGIERNYENGQALLRLRQACNNEGVHLPPALISFFSSPDWQARIRSNTDCYLDLASAPVRSPRGEGVLVRFLADSQGCIFWYLFIPDGTHDHAVVSSPDFYASEQEEAEFDDEPNPAEIVFAEESFEAFMCRFCLENELWFSEYEGTPTRETERKYLESYRAAPADKLGDQPLN